MGKKGGGSKGGGGGKKTATKKKHYQINTIYEGGKAKNKTCPKCGKGMFLADHKDRLSCGKCGYMEKK